MAAGNPKATHASTADIESVFLFSKPVYKLLMIRAISNLQYFSRFNLVLNYGFVERSIGGT